MLENLKKLPLNELRQMWADAWGIEPHARIGQKMLIKSLEFKNLERDAGGFTVEQCQRLEQLIKSYKRNSNFFDENTTALKPGTRLIRHWKGTRHSVLVQNVGYEYKAKTYKSLSEIAFQITGTRWNGWVFFSLKKKEGAA